MKFYLLLLATSLFLSACSKEQSSESLYPFLKAEAPPVKNAPAIDTKKEVQLYQNEISDLNQAKNFIYADSN